jgi:hypothetical protein
MRISFKSMTATEKFGAKASKVWTSSIPVTVRWPERGQRDRHAAMYQRLSADLASRILHIVSRFGTETRYVKLFKIYNTFISYFLNHSKQSAEREYH